MASSQEADDERFAKLIDMAIGKAVDNATKSFATELDKLFVKWDSRVGALEMPLATPSHEQLHLNVGPDAQLPQPIFDEEPTFDGEPVFDEETIDEDANDSTASINTTTSEIRRLLDAYDLFHTTNTTTSEIWRLPVGPNHPVAVQLDLDVQPLHHHADRRGITTTDFTFGTSAPPPPTEASLDAQIHGFSITDAVSNSVDAVRSEVAKLSTDCDRQPRSSGVVFRSLSASAPAHATAVDAHLHLDVVWDEPPHHTAKPLDADGTSATKVFDEMSPPSLRQQAVRDEDPVNRVSTELFTTHSSVGYTLLPDLSVAARCLSPPALVYVVEAVDHKEEHAPCAMRLHDSATTPDVVSVPISIHCGNSVHCWQSVNCKTPCSVWHDANDIGVEACVGSAGPAPLGLACTDISRIWKPPWSFVLPQQKHDGSFIGKGTGVDKEHTIAGLIWENWQHVRQQVLWNSIGSSLKYDALMDLDAIGAKYVQVLTSNKHPYSKLDSETIGITNAVLLVTCSSLIAFSGKDCSCLQQLVQRYGSECYGLLVFAYVVPAPVVSNGRWVSEVQRPQTWSSFSCHQIDIHLDCMIVLSFSLWDMVLVYPLLHFAAKFGGGIFTKVADVGADLVRVYKLQSVTAMLFTENGYLLATAAHDGVKLWDIMKLVVDSVVQRRSTQKPPWPPPTLLKQKQSGDVQRPQPWPSPSCYQFEERRDYRTAVIIDWIGEKWFIHESADAYSELQGRHICYGYDQLHIKWGSCQEHELNEQMLINVSSKHIQKMLKRDNAVRAATRDSCSKSVGSMLASWSHNLNDVSQSSVYGSTTVERLSAEQEHKNGCSHTKVCMAVTMEQDDEDDALIYQLGGKPNFKRGGMSGPTAHGPVRNRRKPNMLGTRSLKRREAGHEEL